MLVLSRKVSERVAIGDDIWVTVVDIQGDRVRLGFTAPRGLPIVREEVLKRALRKMLGGPDDHDYSH